MLSPTLSLVGNQGKNGAGERIRTSDPRITNALLCQLSYSGTRAQDCARRASIVQRRYHGNIEAQCLLRTLIVTSTLSAIVPSGNFGMIAKFTWSGGMSITSPVSTL